MTKEDYDRIHQDCEDTIALCNRILKDLEKYNEEGVSAFAEHEE